VWFAQDWESESSDPGVECYCYSEVEAEIESTLVVDCLGNRRFLVDGTADYTRPHRR